MKTKFKDLQCYELPMWQTYCAGMLDEAERVQMEEHLLHCNACLSVYLAVLEKELQRESAFQVGQDFTDKIMANVQKENYRLKRNNKINLIVSYCAAACIAMFFWVGGYFDKISEGLSEGAKSSNFSKTIEVQFEPPKHFVQTGWTQNVLKREKLFGKSFLENTVLENLLPKKE